MKLIDIAGKRFGRLLVLHQGPPVKRGQSAKWVCRCDCGTEKLVSSKPLRSGLTRSCGCLAEEWASHMGSNPEFIRKRSMACATHGHGGRTYTIRTPEYKTWLRIKSRCYRKTDKDYQNWGGRGITVCDAWRESFEKFIEDMGRKPSPKHSIDRIDASGNYEPSNCRWATSQVQGENRRTVKHVTIDGITFPSIKAACEHYGAKPTAVHYRMTTGIPVELAITHTARMKSRRTKESYLRKDRRPVDQPIKL